MLSQNIYFNGSNWVSDLGGGGAYIDLNNGDFRVDTVGFDGVNAGDAVSPVNRLVVKNTGNVGIGTTNPGSLLQVGAGTRSSTDDILTVIGSTARFSVESTGNGNNSGFRLFAKASNGTLRSTGVYNIPGTTDATSYICLTADDSTCHEVVTRSGNVGIGTTNPQFKLDIYSSTGVYSRMQTEAGNQAMLSFYDGNSIKWSYGKDTDNGAGIFDNAAGRWILKGASSGDLGLMPAGGNVGIGTTSPYAKLSVAGLGVFDNIFATSTTATSTFAGGLDVGNGALSYDFSSGLTSISNLQLGAMSFDTDAGMVSWADMPVTSNAALGTVESYTAQLGGNPVLTVFGTSDGAGGVTSLGVGIGTTSPARLLHVATTTDGPVVRFQDANGYCEIDPTSATWSCTSDARLKKNVSALSASSTLDALLKLKPVAFNWNKEKDTDTQHLGLIAQDVKEIFPSFVTTDEQGMMSVSYGAFTPVLIAAIQEEDARIGALELKLASTTPTLSIPAPSGIADMLAAAIASANSWVGNRIAAVVGVFKDVHTETATVTKGFVITDQATGDAYCVTIENGEWKKVKGDCASSSIVVATTTDPVASTTPTVTATPTPTETSTTTPSVTPTPTPTETATTTPTVVPSPTPSDTPPVESSTGDQATSAPAEQGAPAGEGDIAPAQ